MQFVIGPFFIFLHIHKLDFDLSGVRLMFLLLARMFLNVRGKLFALASNRRSVRVCTTRWRFV